MAKLLWKRPDEFSELYDVLSRESVRNDVDGSFVCTATRAAILAGGLTNRLYCIDTIIGLWVLRVSGENYEVHKIDRVKEYRCIHAAFKANITPDARFIQSDLITVSRFISDGHTWDNEAVQQNVPLCVEVIKALHKIPLSDYSDHRFDVWEVCDHYKTISIQHGAGIPADLEEIYAQTQRMKFAIEKDTIGQFPLVACHNDLLAANWIYGSLDGEKKLWLIDFDYACTGDLFFDLANFSSNCELTRQHDQVIIEQYFDSPDALSQQVFMARLQLFKIMSDFREALWSFVQWGVSKTASQEFYHVYAERLMDRVRTSLQQPECNVWLQTLETLGETTATDTNTIDLRIAAEV